MSKDVRVRGYFSKPKAVCGQENLGNTVLWDMMLLSVVQIYKNSGCTYSFASVLALRLSILYPEQGGSIHFPYMSANSYHTTGCHIAEYDNTETSGLILDAEEKESYIFLQF
jgi:hypothetical protein